MSTLEYTQVIPTDITNLPKYSVSTIQFICICIVMIIFLLYTIYIAITWILRAFHGYSNTDYIADFDVKMQADQTMKKIAPEELSPLDEDFVKECRKWSRNQSRILEFLCLAVIVAINIGTFTCEILECAAFGLAVILFMVFNIFRVREIGLLKLLWLLPILVCYLSFYIFDKRLIEK